jgi:hypothetical protein
MGRVLMPAGDPAAVGALDKHFRRAGGSLRSWLWLRAVPAVVQAGYCSGDFLVGLDRSVLYSCPEVDGVGPSRLTETEEQHR